MGRLQGQDRNGRQLRRPPGCIQGLHVSGSAPLLLDTNVVIWPLPASSRISARARRAMSRPAASLAVSVVSVWEIVLKHQVGKLIFKVSLDEVVDQIVYHSPWTILPMVP